MVGIPHFRLLILVLGGCLPFFAIAESKDSLFLDSLLELKDEKLRTEKLFSFFEDNYQFSQSQSEAQLLIPYALQMLEKSIQPFSKAKSYQALAYMYSRAREYSESAQYAHQALDYWKSIAYKPGIAEMNFHLAYLKMNNGDEQTIVPDCQQALKIAREANSPETISAIASWLGGYYLRLGNIDSSLHYFSMGLAQPGVSTKRKAFNLFDMANCHLMQKKTELARKEFAQSVEQARENHLPLLEGVAVSSLSYTLLLEGKYRESIKLAMEALPLLKKHGRPDFVRDAYATLMEAYEGLGDFKNALGFAKLFNQYADSANFVANQTEYRDLEEKYQSKLKDRLLSEKDQKIKAEEDRRKLLIISIILLILVFSLGLGLLVLNRRRKESLLRERINESEMKALRAQMNPHFMFNSLNAIQQMVLNQENEEAFRYLNTYSKLTRQILENSEKKWISVKDEIRFLELYLQIESLRFDHAFSYQIETGETVMPNTDLIPAMVVQPLVENAIKHGLMPKQGEKRLFIHFEHNEENHWLEVTIEDNGVGRAVSSQTKMDAHHQSMSLGITENRLQLLDASGKSKMEVMDLKDAIGNPAGTLVKINIVQPEKKI